jgi:N-acetyl-anhydromuramyl-L-alanine amidase AmpD
MRKINEIILHCSATPASMDIGAKEIRDWHVNGNHWRDIGYHWVIRRDGTVEKGRPEYQVGAHCLNHNANSIGVCMVGGTKKDVRIPEDNFTEAQFASLAKLVKELLARYPGVTIHGHCEYAAKACPVFSVKAFLRKYGL